MHSFPVKPEASDSRACASTMSRSRTSSQMPSTGAGSPAAADAARSANRAGARRALSSGSRFRSAARSRWPSTRRTTPGAVASPGACRIPAAVSTRGSNAVEGSRAATSADASTDSALATSTALQGLRPSAEPTSASRSMSASPSGVRRSFTRTATGLSRAPPRRSAATCARAPGLAPGATASSRSTTTQSASLVSALENRSGRSPGTNKIRPRPRHVSISVTGSAPRLCGPHLAPRSAVAAIVRAIVLKARTLCHACTPWWTG